MEYSVLYRTNWPRWVRWHVPAPLQQPKTLAFVQAVNLPINDLHTRFLQDRQAILYRLGLSPQVCHMERALNDRFDSGSRGITIVDGEDHPAIPVFRKAESKPLTLPRRGGVPVVPLYTKRETASFVADFVVRVPHSVIFNTSEMVAFIRSIKLTTKTFIIQRV